jgi:DNA sulfur modification protein DndE
MLETIRLSERTKRQLIKIKRRTGIDNWNTLCRWAFCLSILDKVRPDVADPGSQSNVEMTWKTFSGRYTTAYDALARQSLHSSFTQESDLSAVVIQHVERGVSKISTMREVRSISDLLGLANSKL